MQRSANCLKKVDRLNKTLHHQEADRVPLSDFFWGGFLERWRAELGLPSDADIYTQYDLDWLPTMPNMDPHIQPFEMLKETDEEVVVKTGFGAVIQKKLAHPMPAFLRFETDTLDKMAGFTFDDPFDPRRFFSAGDNQVAGVGDGFARNSPAWIEGVKSRWPDIPVYGSMCEAHEILWRIIGSENTLLWIGLYPDEIARFIERIARFCIDLVSAQIQAADGLLDGIVIWGDVAYRKDLLFSPLFWRKHFKPVVTEMVSVAHAAGLPVIYHGCGNVTRILPDFIDTGIDAYNPLEAKAGLDVVDLRRQYGHRLGFCGNMDVMTWADAPLEQLKQAVLYRLNAAKGGGYIFQSDHSVPTNISAQRYEFVVKLVREYGRYPLALGSYDVPLPQV